LRQRSYRHEEANEGQRRELRHLKQMPTYNAFSNWAKIRNPNIEFGVLSVGHTEANVAPVVAVLEMNAGDSLIRACACGFER
jgi:hypothetical protein